MDEIGIGFLYAPMLHSAMKHALVPRREIGIRTIFNVLGPLTNPARPEGQVVGVPKAELAPFVARCLQRLGTRRAWVVSGSGLDELTLTGPDLEEAQQLLFSHPGLKGEIVPPPPPDPKKPPPPPPQPNQPVTVQAKVTIAPDTPLGLHDVRVVNKWGVSSPRAFVVGDLPEVLEKEPNNDVAEAQRVAVNNTINGVVAAPTDVDYYVFAGTKGQHVLLSCLALSIDSRMQAAVEVYDAAGRLLGANRRYQGGRHYPGSDALVDVTLPDNGDYYVRVYHFTYIQGNAEHFYRLTISTAPWIDAVFPPAVEPGKPATLTVYGRNLPGGKPDAAAVIDGKILERLTVTVTPPAATQQLVSSGPLSPSASMLDGFDYRLRNDAGFSNPYLLTFAQAPVVVDNENNDTPEAAQEVPLPCEIAGRVEKKRDRDWYQFTAKKGDVFNIEVISDRLGAPTDMYFLLRNPATKADIVEGDDNPEGLNPKFFARTDDPAVYRFVVPADGKYQLLVASRLADTLADPRHVYRVRLTPDRPDFRLVVMPADFYRPDSCTLLQGSNECFSVFAWRQDGFNGDIALTVEGLPAGVTCVPQGIGKGQKQATLVLSAAADAAAWTGAIKVKGTATINGQPAVREARSASITWPVQPQQNIPTQSRLDRSLVLAVRDKAPFGLTATIDKATLLIDPKTPDKATVTLKVVRTSPDVKNPLQIVVADLIPNVLVNNNQPVTIAANADTATVPVQVNAAALPGTFTLVLRAQTQLPQFSKDPKDAKAPKAPANLVFPSTPLTLTVLPKEIATVTATVANPNVKAGAETEVVVKVARKYDYAGEFKVELVLPPNTVGVSAATVTIPAGADEVKVMLKAAADAAAGPRNDLVLKASAMYGAQATTQEAKFNVNVVK